MSLDVSPEIEARIAAKAREAGLSVENYLELVVEESDEFAANLRMLEATNEPLSREEIQAKIDRGLAQLELGDSVDGEQFMADLLSSIEDAERKRRSG
jgi:predicted transcriptional regulator